MAKHWKLHSSFLQVEAVLTVLFVALIQEEQQPSRMGDWSSLYRLAIAGVFGLLALVSTLLVALTRSAGWTKGIHGVLGSLFLVVGGFLPAAQLSEAFSRKQRTRVALECFRLRSWHITPQPGRRLRMEGVLGYGEVLKVINLDGHSKTSGAYHLNWDPGKGEFKGQAGELLQVDLPLDERASADLVIHSIHLTTLGPAECRGIQLEQDVSEPRAVFLGRDQMVLLLPLPPPASSE